MKKKVTQFVKKNKVLSIIAIFLILIGLGGLVIYLTKKPEKEKKAVVKKPPVKKPPPKVQVKTTVVEEPEPTPAATVGTITGQAGPVGFGAGGGGGSGGASYDRSAENAAKAAKYKSKRASLANCQKRTGGTCVQKGDTGEFFDPETEASSLISLEDAMVQAHNEKRGECGLTPLVWDKELTNSGVNCFEGGCNNTNINNYSFSGTLNLSENYYEKALNSWLETGSDNRKLVLNTFPEGNPGNNFFCEEDRKDDSMKIRCVYGNQISDESDSEYLDFDENYEEEVCN